MATTVTNETKPQPESLPDAALAYKYVTFVNRMAKDDWPLGGQLSSWRPNLDIDWYYLGQGAEPDGNWDHAPLGIIVHALEADALRDVVRWEKVWAGFGLNEETYFALWSGVPPSEDYVVVGGIFSTNKDWAEPSYEQTRGIKAIRRDLLVMDDTFNVWHDKHDKTAASVWKTWGREGPSPWALIPRNSDRAPPRDMSFSLDRNKTLEMQGEWSWDRATGKFPIPDAVHSQEKDVVGSK